MKLTKPEQIVEALDFPAFCDWLLDNDTGAVFLRGHCSRCPIATYLAEVLDFTVIIDGARACPDGDIERDQWVHLPGWVKFFILLVDEDEAGTITVGQALDIVHLMEV